MLVLPDGPEWAPRMLQSLVAPLRSGEVTLARADGPRCYPTRFQLLLTAPVCPCGPPRERACVCSPSTRHRYLGRLPGVLLDRIDVCARTHPITPGDRDGSSESTATVRERVVAARERVVAARAAAAERWAPHGWSTNAQVPPEALSGGRLALRPADRRPVDTALRAGELTLRGAHRALRVAWTLADLAGRPYPDSDLVAAALALRRRW